LQKFLFCLFLTASIIPQIAKTKNRPDLIEAVFFSNIFKIIYSL